MGIVVMSGWLFPVHTRYMLCALYQDGDLGCTSLRHQWKIEGWDRLPDGPAIAAQAPVIVGDAVVAVSDAARPDLRL